MRQFIFAVAFFGALAISNGQVVQNLPERESSKSYPIDPMPLLYKHYEEAAAYAVSHPDIIRNKLMKETASCVTRVVHIESSTNT